MEFFIDYFVPIKAATVFHEDAVKIRNTNQGADYKNNQTTKQVHNFYLDQ